MARDKTNRVTCRMTEDRRKELDRLSKQMGVSKSDVLNISLDYFTRLFNGLGEQGVDNERTKETKTRKTEE